MTSKIRRNNDITSVKRKKRDHSITYYPFFLGFISFRLKRKRAKITVKHLFALVGDTIYCNICQVKGSFKLLNLITKLNEYSYIQKTIKRNKFTGVARKFLKHRTTSHFTKSSHSARSFIDITNIFYVSFFYKNIQLLINSN